MISARMRLQQAYSVFLGTPENLAMARPKDNYKPMPAKRRAVIRDGSGTITSTPSPICHATETFTGRTSTTQRVAAAIDAGQLIAAAECQPAIRSLWLQFAYNPALDLNDLQRNSIRAQLRREMIVLWCLSPKRKRPSMQMSDYGELLNSVRYLRLLDAIVVDCAVQYRTKGPGRHDLAATKTGDRDEQETKLYPSKWARCIGFETTQAANWNRDWRPHAEDMIDLVDMVDRIALGPVVEVLQRRRDAEDAAAVW